VAFLVAVGVFLACIIAGGILMGTGHIVIGILVFLGSLPAAIAGWIKWSDRY
jgi:hypothetical protein